MFTKLYLDTTNPEGRLSDWLAPSILFPMMVSILVHTIMYVSVANLASYIFTGKALAPPVNTRLLACLTAIMTFGYVARFYHVKDVYRAYHQDATKTRQHLDRLYIGWIFIA